MKKGFLIAAVLVMVLAFGACSSQTPTEVIYETEAAKATETTTESMTTEATMAEEASTEASTEATTEAAMEEKTFTLEELAQYDGKNGNMAYVAVNGVVYDVTDVPAWTNGQHNGNMAGQDVTEALKKAPHGDSTLEGLPIVGKLAE